MENKKDLSFRERALGIAATAERVLVRIGKIGLVLAVVATTAITFVIREEAEDLDRQVDALWKTAYSPDRSWVARELVLKGALPLAVPTGKFICGEAGSLPKVCTPDPYVARTTELCIFPRTADGWPKTFRPAGMKPNEFGTPQLCPELILHPGK